MNTGRRLVAFVLPESPYPPVAGNAVRDGQQIALVRRLGYCVTLLCVRPRVGSSALADKQAAAENGVEIAFLSEKVLDHREGWPERIGRKVSYLRENNARNPFAWWCAPYALRAALPQRVAAMAPAVVVLRSLFVDLLPPLRREFNGAIIVDCHDADVHLAREMIRSVRWWRAAGPWANYRGVSTVCRRFLPLADEIWAVSAEDAERICPYAGPRPILVVPSAVDEGQIVPAADPGCDDVCVLVANFGYGPNLNGARWLVKRVWPQVRQARPTARLLLVGGGAAGQVRDLASRAPGIVATGLLEDLRAIYTEAGVMLAPLHEGGGSRLKIVEAWKHGKAVLTTSKGIEGINTPGGTAAIADSADRFAATLVRLLTEPDERRRLGDAGRRCVAERLSFERVGGELARRSLLAPHPPEVARASG